MLICENSSPFVQNILLIDSTIKDYQEVVDSINDNTMAIIYDYNCTFEDLSNVFINYHISRLGIFCHSNALFFNNQRIYTDVSGMIDFIEYFTIENIDFLACNTLKMHEYKTFYAKLPCIVGASNDETGNIKYGGDWIMETTGEDIENIYFTKNIKYYRYLLAADVTNQTWGQPTNIARNEAYGMCILNGCLLLTTSDSNGSMIAYSNTYVIGSGNALNNRSYYPLSTSNVGSGYIGYGSTSITLTYNGYSLFAITSPTVSSSLYYLSYIKGIIISTTSGTVLATGMIGLFGSTSQSKQQWTSLTNVNKNSGIVSSNQNIYIGSTTGYIMRYIINDTASNVIPGNSSSSSTTWCYTNINSAILGMAIDTTTNYLYAINALGTIFKINLSNTTFITFATVANGTSLAILNGWLFVSVRLTTPTSTTSFGTGNITKIPLYLYQIPPITIYSPNYYTTYTPSILSLCSYNNGTNYLFSLSMITKSNAGTSYATTSSFNTTIARYIINNPPIMNVTTTPFKFNFNGTMLDLNSLLIDSTDNLNNIGQNTNYNILNNYNDTSYDLGSLYQNSNTLNLDTIQTNYYILVGDVYRDISNYFTYNPLFDDNILSINIPSATVIKATSPSKISYNWELSSNGIGSYTINGTGNYYIIINGILSPYYDRNLSVSNTGSFVYINGINTIEIFTNKSIIAEFVASSTLYTATSGSTIWTNSTITGFVSPSVTTSDMNIERFSINTTTISSGTIAPVQGAITTFEYIYGFNTIDSGSDGLVINNYTYLIDNIYASISKISSTKGKYISTNIFIENWEGTNTRLHKVIGYFCPTSTGIWNFDITADDCAIFHIGVSSSMPATINPYLGDSPSDTQCACTYTTGNIFPTTFSFYGYTVKNRASVQLTENLYYPILLYHGQSAGLMNLELKVSCETTGIVYTNNSIPYRNLFYYLSSYPTY